MVRISERGRFDFGVSLFSVVDGNGQKDAFRLDRYIVISSLLLLGYPLHRLA